MNEINVNVALLKCSVRRLLFDSVLSYFIQNIVNDYANDCYIYRLPHDIQKLWEALEHALVTVHWKLMLLLTWVRMTFVILSRNLRLGAHNSMKLVVLMMKLDWMVRWRNRRLIDIFFIVLTLTDVVLSVIMYSWANSMF